ncbi:MAG: hypothetical protein D9C04_04105 [Nitrosopumilus sp. B06]|nr:MAG: hypothetical protein EB828_04810 [Nitrosopumilus sp. D6]RNJ79684.1 MAG: hypothetical protein D9C04_04105 [Nitrosopumilus sp. B06]
MNTDSLVKIGTVLIGGGVLFVNIIHVGVAAWDLPEAFTAQMLVVVPGLATGVVLIAGAKVGKTVDRRFVGICMVLVGAMFLWAGIVSAVLRDFEVLGAYKILVFGPVGVPLGVALLVIGLRIFAHERLVGLCMMIPGVGFLPFFIYIVIDYTLGIEASDILPVIEIIAHGGAVVGTILMIPSLVIVWQTRHM